MAKPELTKETKGILDDLSKQVNAVIDFTATETWQDLWAKIKRKEDMLRERVLDIDPKDFKQVQTECQVLDNLVRNDVLAPVTEFRRTLDEMQLQTQDYPETPEFSEKTGRVEWVARKKK